VYKDCSDLHLILKYVHLTTPSFLLIHPLNKYLVHVYFESRTVFSKTGATFRCLQGLLIWDITVRVSVRFTESKGEGYLHDRVTFEQ
jgi:hypothetical protein